MNETSSAALAVLPAGSGSPSGHESQQIALLLSSIDKLVQTVERQSVLVERLILAMADAGDMDDIEPSRYMDGSPIPR